MRRLSKSSLHFIQIVQYTLKGVWLWPDFGKWNIGVKECNMGVNESTA